MEDNWTSRTKNGTKKYAYELMKHAGWRIQDPEDIHPAAGGYKISYLCDTKRDAERLGEKAKEIARELGIRVYAANTRRYAYDSFGGGEDWRSDYSFLYDSEHPADIEEWNRLMDEYDMPVQLEWDRENPATSDRGRRGYWYEHENLGIKFLDRKAISSPNFKDFMSKAAEHRYWINIIVEPYYPEK